MPMAIMTLVVVVPSRAMIVTASRIAGKASSTSMQRMSTLSSQPPK